MLFAMQPLVAITLAPLMGTLLAFVCSLFGAMLVVLLLTSSNDRVLAFHQDGSVTVSRVGLFRSKLTPANRSYPADTSFDAELSTPWWRTQRLLIGQDAWFPVNPKTRFSSRVVGEGGYSTS